MRGDEQSTGHLFSCVSPEERVPADYPTTAIMMWNSWDLKSSTQSPLGCSGSSPIVWSRCLISTSYILAGDLEGFG